MTPRALQKYIARCESLKVTEEQVKEWLEHPCTVALHQELLAELQSVWLDLLLAKEPDQHAQLRGQYMQIDQLIDIHNEFNLSSKQATQDEINTAKKDLEDFYHGPRNG